MLKHSATSQKKIYRIFYILQILLLFSLLLLILFLYPHKLTPVVVLEDGPIQGSVAYSRNGSEYWQYLGIPYAKPPLGKLAYAPPQNSDKWEEVRRSTQFSNECLQFDWIITARVKGNMDCLYLNVFVHKKESDNETKPVLVWIHGGGHLSGSSAMYHPEYLMDHDLIVVTLNYRLGIYGFLNLGTDQAQGNMALLDQNKVLLWVQRNIGYFGGDPNRVTLMGESAGAAHVHLHCLSDMSNGLFQKAIIQSGTAALMPWEFSHEPIKAAQTFAKNIGCTGSNLSHCYENLGKEKLVHQNWWLDPLAKDDLFRPSVDGHFLKEAPEQILKSGRFPPIPVIFGVNSAEGVIRSARFAAMPELIEQLDQDWDNLLENLLLLDIPLSSETAREIRKQYFGNGSFMEDTDAFLEGMTKFMSDVHFFKGIHQSAVWHAKRGAPVYAYYFNYTSKIFPGSYSTLSSIRMDSWILSELQSAWTVLGHWWMEYVFGRGRGSHVHGVGHAEDILQFWNFMEYSKYFGGWDMDFSTSAVKAVADFVEDKVPLSFNGVSWPVINFDLKFGNDEHHIPFMLMDNEATPRVVPEPFAKRLAFWDRNDRIHLHRFNFRKKKKRNLENTK